jgi:hypothetical protein
MIQHEHRPSLEEYSQWWELRPLSQSK